MKKKIIDAIIEYLKENTSAYESYERGDVELKINNAECINPDPEYPNNEFWEEVKNDLEGVIQSID